MSEHEMYSPEEIQNAVNQASASEVALALAKESGKESDALLAKGILLSEKVVERILDGQQEKTRNIERYDEPTL